MIFLLVSLCLVLHDETVYSQSCLIIKYDESGNRLSMSLCDCGSEYKPSLERDMMTNSNYSVDEDFEMSIYPNPTEGVFEIRVNDTDDDMSLGDIQLINLQGVLVFSDSFADNIHIDISDKPPGVYLLKFSRGDVMRTSLVVKI